MLARYLDRTATVLAGQDAELEHPLQPLRPCHRDVARGRGHRAAEAEHEAPADQGLQDGSHTRLHQGMARAEMGHACD